MTFLHALVSWILAIPLLIFGGFHNSVADFNRVTGNEPRLSAHVIFGGDMMFDRTVRTTIDREGGDYIFECLDPVLQEADLVVANLEGPITATTSKSVDTPIGSPDNFTFTFPLSTANLLARHGVGIVNLGNNHILNFGFDGARETIAALDSSHAEYFGDPLTQRVATTSLNGVHLAFINYNEFAPRGSGSAQETIDQIRAARAIGEIPVVYTHWGIEYATTSSPYMQSLAHSFIDAGAEIVIGSHPHVVEEHEIYRAKYIYYSLGNMIFDQYWNNDVRRGLLLNVEFDSQRVVNVHEIPIQLEHSRQTCPVR